MRKTRVKRRRELYFDLLWIISAFFMIFSYSEGANAYALCESGSVAYYVCLLFTIFSRFPLWLCLMISGALLLEEEESLLDIWKKRISRVALILVIFSFFYYVNDLFRNARLEGGGTDWEAFWESFDLTRFIPDLYSRDQIPQFWYLYAYLGFLICLPFLRPMVKNMRNNTFIYLITAVFVLSSILPLIDSKILLDRYSLNPNMKLGWLMEVIFIYPVMGYFFHHRLERGVCRKIAPFLIGIDLVWMVYYVYMMAMSGVSHGNYDMYPSYHSPCTMLHCVTFFIVAKAYFSCRERSSGQRVIGSFGGCTLGIYLMHGFFLDDRIHIIEKLRLALGGRVQNGNALFAGLFWALFVYLSCFVLTWLVRRIPGMKKLTL
ncbi:MAG: acyltransferase [Lachnospiraceae bacterium]|nr:acyltransferase [Lachnospiraceae bacterium]